MTSYIDPSRENFDRFKALPRDTAVHMLNLVRFKAQADYPEGHPLAGKGLTGKQAYDEYFRTIQPVLERAGGHIVWKGAFEAMVTGPSEWEWDETFVMAYPSAAAFMGMVKDPDYAPVVVHRQAAVEDSRLVRFAPVES
ncbi:DUF1330 domain-containing protein [Novosphingobium sp. KCTC 2891]|uniref:DUF1330 domain-containing protein n=1 Tax=Novosphingobium sp. KCTC 2891 TaxID=2989730 RepID=UPI002221B4A0|nr:DUF1330 domain-containing protein [Novosphingobium sp. KCTC 2891]MCW1384189.1 DUF1330 domain-containing protein [Novosphingobium sp. KCTC 2891]